MCDKTVDACLRALKLVPDWFVSNKMLEKLDDVVFSNDDIVFVNENSDNVKFLVMIWPLTLYTLIILLLMMIDNFDDDVPETIICVRLLV